MSTALPRRYPLAVINRGRRTLWLALLASLTLVWAAIYSFDVPVEEMAWLALYSAAGVFTIALMGTICGPVAVAEVAVAAPESALSGCRVQLNIQ